MTSSAPYSLSVGLVGAGLIGRKRAAALGHDSLVGCFDVVSDASEALVADFGGHVFRSLDELLNLRPDVVVVATIHSALTAIACAALEAGANVLVEKPAGASHADVARLAVAAESAGRLVKVGFNHRFHPGIARAITEARSGLHGEVFYLRATYGHGGRLGYEKEWRADPKRSGGGEIVDQGIHLLDLSYWLFGEMPVAASLLRTQFWDAPVDDNAVIVLGADSGVGSPLPFALLHTSWTEWKNTFSLDIACRHAKLAVSGLSGSYGPQELRIYRMRPELGPPDLEEVRFPNRDTSWASEWQHFREAIVADDGRSLLGDLRSARYAWACVERAQQK